MHKIEIALQQQCGLPAARPLFRPNFTERVLSRCLLLSWCHFTEGGTPRPFVCGGQGGDYISSDKCYIYNGFLDTWTVSGEMPEGLDSSRYDHSEMWGLVMAGGMTEKVYNTKYLSNVTTTKTGQVFNPLPDLPDKNFLSCVVIIDEDRIFTFGGFYTENDTLIFSNSTGSWKR